MKVYAMSYFNVTDTVLLSSIRCFSVSSLLRQVRFMFIIPPLLLPPIVYVSSYTNCRRLLFLNSTIFSTLSPKSIVNHTTNIIINVHF